MGVTWYCTCGNTFGKMRYENYRQKKKEFKIRQLLRDTNCRGERGSITPGVYNILVLVLYLTEINQDNYVVCVNAHGSTTVTCMHLPPVEYVVAGQES